LNKQIIGVHYANNSDMQNFMNYVNSQSKNITIAKYKVSASKRFYNDLNK